MKETEIQMINAYKEGADIGLMPGSTSEKICLALAIDDFDLLEEKCGGIAEGWDRLNTRQQKIVKKFNDKYSDWEIGSIYG